MKAYAPAKINLGLEIIKKRSDGYHDVDMIMQSINLFDEIEVQTSNSGKINVLHEFPVDFEVQKDLTYKAANMFFEYLKKPCEGLEIKIKKRIPFSAGLAGGSADGAAVLVMLNRMYGEIFSLDELMQIGEKIGSDVPFCILGGTARATDKGQLLEKIENNLKYFLVLVKPKIDVSTEKAYSMFDNLNCPVREDLDLLQFSLKTANFNQFSGRLFNRFEDFILPELINGIKKEFLECGAKGALMSGSGPSVYGVFEDKASADTCFEIMKKRYEAVFMCQPLDTGCVIEN